MKSGIVCPWAIDEASEITTFTVVYLIMFNFRFVYAEEVRNGSYVKPILRSYCSDSKKEYNMEKDACESKDDVCSR